MPGLRRLDEVVLPRLDAALRRVADAFTALHRWEVAPQRPWALRAVATRPGMVALAAGLVVFAAAALHAQRLTAPAGPEPADAEVAPAAIGPRTGDRVDEYVQRRSEAVAALPAGGRVRAVVSFTDHLDVDALEAFSIEGVDIERVQLRLPLPDDPPLDVEVDDRGPAVTVAAVLGEEGRRLAEEEDDVRRQVEEGVDDPEFQADYERRLAELGEAQRELEGSAAVVFAVVVVADVDDLRRLADRRGVRLVDPAGPEEATRTTSFYGLLPDDTDRVSVGRPG